MAVRKPAGKDQSGKTTTDVVEQKVVELAEQLGWFLGTVQAKAEGWLDREALKKEVGRIRDGAVELLDHVNRASAQARTAAAKPGAPKPAAPPPVAKAAAARPVAQPPVSKPVAKPAAAPTMRASRGPVDAPGKSHRKPPPQERLDKRMGEPVGKQMGQKGFKHGTSRGRG